MLPRKQKTIFQLDTPFTAVCWPKVNPEDRCTIFEVLIRVLTPLGNHRANYVTLSKGKRSQKRKRRDTKLNHGGTSFEEIDALPPKPEVSSHLLVGLASITRHLELVARAKTLDGAQERFETNMAPTSFTQSAHGSKIEAQHLAAIFVCRSSQPSILHNHLPELIATASSSSPHLEPTRLVQLPQDSGDRLASALGLPRASFVAIMEDAPNSRSLLKLVQEKVPIIEVPWLEEARKAQHKPVKINSILTTAPVGKKIKKEERALVVDQVLKRRLHNGGGLSEGVAHHQD